MKILLLASAALSLVAVPALAQKNDKGHKGSHGQHSGGQKNSGVKHGGEAKHMKSDRKAGTAQHGRSRLSARVDGNRNGVLDSREHNYRDRDRDGRDDRFENEGNRFAARNCPPGLAKKNNGCLPPGQAKRLFNQGQRVPEGYDYYTEYSNIPQQYRTEYNLDPNSNYIYRDDSIYVVDPRTSLVERVIGLLIGR